jgi:hypothetical protein
MYNYLQSVEPVKVGIQGTDNFFPLIQVSHLGRLPFSYSHL